MLDLRVSETLVTWGTVAFTCTLDSVEPAGTFGSHTHTGPLPVRDFCSFVLRIIRTLNAFFPFALNTDGDITMVQ